MSLHRARLPSPYSATIILTIAAMADGGRITRRLDVALIRIIATLSSAPRLQPRVVFAMTSSRPASLGEIEL